MNDLVLNTLFLSLTVICIYWFAFFISLYFYKPYKSSSDSNEHLPVTIIIVCKNEAKNIAQTVTQILKQNYPTFELLVIDDFSTDNTLATLKSITDSRLTIISAIENHPGKKKALTQAIHEAQYELLLLTDADCLPSGTNWITSMVQVMQSNQQNQIVLGYSPMIKQKSWINRFARYETVLTAMQYFSYTLSGIPYMGVGRNLMYNKSLFLSTDGHKMHEHIASGDDDLFIRDAANKHNTAINLASESFVYTQAKQKISSFLKQKSRHISTASHYKPIHQIGLTIFALSQIVFYIALVIGLITGTITVIYGVLLLGIKWVVQIAFQYKWFIRLDASDLLPWFPLLDILMVKYYFILPVYKLFASPKRWK